jgi:hypothetical protein
VLDGRVSGYLKFIHFCFFVDRLELILPDAPTSIPLEQFINNLPKNTNQQFHKVKSAEPTFQNPSHCQNQTSTQHQQTSFNSQNSMQINEKVKIYLRV